MTVVTWQAITDALADASDWQLDLIDNMVDDHAYADYEALLASLDGLSARLAFLAKHGVTPEQIDKELLLRLQKEPRNG